MKKILTSFLLFTIALTVLAVPAKRQWHTLTLANGSTVEAMLTGDEHGHWYTDHNGNTLSIDSDGNARYLSTFEISTLEANRAKRLERHATTQRASRIRRSSQSDGQGFFGKKKGVIILANFADKKFIHEKQELWDLANLEGYSKNGSIGSARDYFIAQSYGQFELDFDVVGPILLPEKMAYYGGNDSYGNDLRIGEFAATCMQLADSLVNYADYDWDGDGEAEQVYIIYAGYGEASSGLKNTIWPHEYTLTEAVEWDDGPGPITLDGIRLDTYACSNELNSGTKLAGIGTVCHEFSHCLGFPDFYDTVGNSFGMSSWDVLDYGSWGNDGYVPAAYTSYERWTCGWLDPHVLTDPEDITDMHALTDSAQAYVIYNDNHPDEYYLLENRQQKGWDVSLSGHGMLILHVDYDADAWKDNAVNDVSSRQRMTIFSAGRKNPTYFANSSDPFPGTKNVTSFTDTTSTAATLYNANTDGKKFMHKPITSIQETDALISFSFKNDTPTGMEDIKMTPNPFTDASYNLSGRRVTDMQKNTIYIRNGKKYISK